MAEWQPIETAPRDGTEIFVWGSCEMSPFSRPHVGSEEVHRVYFMSGVNWTVCSANAECYVPEPTHWMPLPEPPSG